MECLEIVVYNKPNNKLTKLFIGLQDLLTLAARENLNLKEDKEMKALLQKYKNFVWDG